MISASSRSSSHSQNSNASQDSSSHKLIRASIKKHMPLGVILARGNGNPITLHSVDEALFANLWSLVAETMVVGGTLSRETKEKIALQVSDDNDCPLCAKIHDIMGKAAPKDKHSGKKMVSTSHRSDSTNGTGSISSVVSSTLKKDSPEAVLAYAAAVQSATKSNRRVDDTDYAHVTARAKREASLVVFLFQHMNRVVSCLLKEEMTTCMMGVPSKVARPMEQGVMLEVMKKMMTPLMRSKVSEEKEEGLAQSLFKASDIPPKWAVSLPSHLAGVEECGFARAYTLERLVIWTHDTYSSTMQKYISRQMLCYIEGTLNTLAGASDDESPEVVLQDIRYNLTFKYGDESAPVGMVLLMVAAAPRMLKASSDWKAVVETIGKDQAQLVVMWYSIRHTLTHAKGLEDTDSFHDSFDLEL